MTNVKQMLEDKIRARNPKTFEEAIDIVHAVQKEILVERQKKYGKANIEKFGLKGVVIRENDKLERAVNLLFNGGGERVEDETIEDTFIDMANYPTIGLLLMEDMWKLPLAVPEPTKKFSPIPEKARAPWGSKTKK